MRKLLLALVMPAFLLCACTTAGAIGAIVDTVVTSAQPAAAAGDKVVLEGTRGLILAHNAYQGAEAIVAPLIRARVLTSAQVDRVEQINNQAEQLFAKAHDVKSSATDAAQILNLADELNKIAGK